MMRSYRGDSVSPWCQAGLHGFWRQSLQPLSPEAIGGCNATAAAQHAISKGVVLPVQCTASCGQLAMI